MTPPNNTKQVRAFIGLIHYYRDIRGQTVTYIPPFNVDYVTKVEFQ